MKLIVYSFQFGKIVGMASGPKALEHVDEWMAEGGWNPAVTVIAVDVPGTTILERVAAGAEMLKVVRLTHSKG